MTVHTDDLFVDQFDVVRAFYWALNRADVDRAVSLYDSGCITEDVFPGGDQLIVRGRDENRRRLQRFVDEFGGALEGGDYYRIRTIGGIGTGWGWVQADWVQRLTVRASGETIGVRGYSHFLVEDGLIRRHRSVVAPEVGLEPDASSSIHADPGGEARSHRHYPDRPVVGVGAVILVTDDDRGAIGWSGPPCMPCGVVLIKRRFEPLAGQWSLPGGTLEVGETLEAGVAREIAEETGLAVEVGPVVEVFDRILFDEARRVRYHFVLIDYLCRPRAGPLQSGSDVSDVIVADPSRLGDYHLTAKAEGVIRRALQMRVPE